MANWYTTTFKTKDKDIVKVIKDNCIEFHYSEDDGTGCCRLRGGIGSLDLDVIEDIIYKNKPTFNICAYDIYTDVEHTLVCENGDVKVCERKQLDSSWRYDDE